MKEKENADGTFIKQAKLAIKSIEERPDYLKTEATPPANKNAASEVVDTELAIGIFNTLQKHFSPEWAFECSRAAEEITAALQQTPSVTPQPVDHDEVAEVMLESFKETSILTNKGKVKFLLEALKDAGYVISKADKLKVEE